MSKIALIGAHRATKLKAPYDDADWDIWACSAFNESELPRHDVWFEIHDLRDRVVIDEIGPVYLEWLKDQKNIYMQTEYPEYPNAAVYPIDEVLNEFGPYFFTGTISYMMAMAILEAPEVIGIWGVGKCPECSHQLSSIRHFVQEALDSGIDVISPAFPELLVPPPLYAFS